MSSASDATRATICVVACAEAFRGDGEILASPIGTIPMIGARLARATFEPDLLITDGEALFVGQPAAGRRGRADEGRRGLDPVPHGVRRGRGTASAT